MRTPITASAGSILPAAPQSLSSELALATHDDQSGVVYFDDVTITTAMEPQLWRGPTPLSSHDSWMGDGQPA